MEAKDFILLMLIPILLVSIVLYTDSTTTITGAVTSQQEESNVIGTYSINPSFKAKEEYALEEEYKSIKGSLDVLIEQCKSEQNIEQCLKDKSSKLNWNCEEQKDEAEEILHDFADKINECISLEEDGVVCRFSLEEREIGKLIENFFILLTNEAQMVRADLTHGKTWTKYVNLKNLVYTNYNNKDTLSEDANSIRIKIDYTGKKPIVEDIFAVAGTDNSKIIHLSKTFLLYKKGDEIKFVEAEAPRSSFEAPLPANKIIDLPRIKGMKLCAKSKSSKQIYAYDKSDNTVKLRELVYKFAVTFPNPPEPPPVQFLKAEDKQKAENSIILRWSKVKLEDGSDFPDLSHYNIYCSKNPSEDKSTKEIKIENLKPTIAVRSDKNYDEWITDLNKCGNENIKDNTDYYFAVNAVSKSGKESKAIRQATASSIDDLAPGLQKIVLINSDNLKEEKTSSACMNLPAEKDKKPGYIWVGFFAPEKNEDGNDLALTEVLTYYLHFSKQNPITSNLNDCSDSKKCVKLTFVPEDDFVATQQEIDLRTFDKLESYYLEEGQTYCFTIVAKDDKDEIGNIIKSVPYEFKTPQQWSELENKPVTKGLVDEKGQVAWGGMI